MYKVLLIVLFFSFCSFQDTVGPDILVRKAAESQLPHYLEKLHPGNERAYGFGPDDDLDRCEVGKPYRMLVFTPEFYKNKLEPERNYIITRNEWRVPVSIKDTNRTLLTVEGNPGNYYVSGMGAPALAMELQAKSKGLNEDDAFYLLQVPDLLADFLGHEKNNSFTESEFIPLESALVAIPELSKKSKGTYSLIEVEQIIKNALSATSAQPAKEDPKTDKPKKSPAK